MVTTRAVLAVGAIAILAAGVYLLREGRDLYAAWLLTFGFGVATLWGILTTALSFEGRSGVPTDGAIALTSMATAFTLYYLYKAVDREPVR